MTLATPPSLAPVVRLWPDASVSRRPGRGAGLLVLPGLRAPRVLVPTGTPAAARMLNRFTKGRGHGLARAIVRYGVRAGVVELLPVPRLVTGPPQGTIEEHVRRHVPAATSVGVLLGPPRANAKPVLQVFAADGRCLAFGKVGHTSTSSELVRHEATVLQDPRLHALSEVRVPAVIDAGAWQGMDVLLTEAMPAAQSGSHSWEIPAGAVREIAESAPVEWSSVRDSTYWPDLRSRIGVLDDQTGRTLCARADRVFPLVEHVVLGFGRWHGDFSPWNCGHGRPALEVWDWEQSKTGVPLGMDAVHFVVQRALHEADDPAGTLRRIRTDALPVLDPWYDGTAGPDATALLYLLEILHRYARQAAERPGGPLTERSARLGAALDLLCSEVRAASFGRA